MGEGVGGGACVRVEEEEWGVKRRRGEREERDGIEEHEGGDAGGLENGGGEVCVS